MINFHLIYIHISGLPLFGIGVYACGGPAKRFQFAQKKIQRIASEVG